MQADLAVILCYGRQWISSTVSVGSKLTNLICLYIQNNFSTNRLHDQDESEMLGNDSFLRLVKQRNSSTDVTQIII